MHGYFWQLIMPLVVLCGLPSSGKTRRVGELIAFLAQVNDCNLVQKRVSYAVTIQSKIVLGLWKPS